MFCPNCGQDCGDAKFCSECGQNLRKCSKKPKTDPQKEQKPLDLEQYYQKYKPDRLQAIMAFGIDTGMRAHEAQKFVDTVFDAHENKEQAPCVDQADIRTSLPGFSCPNCFSTDIKTQLAYERRRKVYARHCYGNSAVKLVASIIDLSSSIISYSNRKNLQHICKSCGYQWQSKQE
jgi:hypothetical protein